MAGDNHKLDQTAERVVGRLVRIEGIAAVAVGGSYARAAADDKSDLDLGIYYDPEKPFSREELSEAARALDDRHLTGLVTGLGEWGPGVNGGGWLIVGGRHVDLLYRDLARVRQAIEDCRAGRISAQYQLGHPLGFHNQIYMGEVFHCRPLHDPRGVLRELKNRATPYPAALSRALLDKHLFDAEFELRIADTPAQRGDAFCVVGMLFRAAGFMALALHALNRRYFINEKGALRELGREGVIKPPEFVETVEQILGNPGIRARELTRSVARMSELFGAVREVCVIQRRLMPDSAP